MGHKDAKESTNGTSENATGFDINTDENISGSNHLNEPVAEESVTDKLKEDLQESKDKYLRLAAEFDNFKRRNAKERVELIQTAGRDVITDMLEILDDIERAEKQLESTAEATPGKDGLTLIFNKFRNKLQSKGLKPMDAVGKDFDADLYEAITEIPAPTSELKGKVVDEIIKGYYLNDKIIRHAKVVVGK